MPEDAELLRHYAAEKSEPAFAALVRRHVNFVYACALRRVGGDAQLAEDVTQQVFTTLARDAASLARREVLSGWLYTTARNASAQIVRTERRRRTREQEAHVMNEFSATSAMDADWEQLRPMIDDALDRLRDDEREAVLLRFFEGKSFAEVGTKLRLTENTARMRVERALDKLQSALTRRGLTSTTAALGAVLANQVSAVAPAGLAASVTGVALTGGGAVSASAAGWVIFMSMTKLQLGIVGAVAVAGAAGFAVQGETHAALRKEITMLQGQQDTVAALRTENRQLAAVAAEIEMLRRDDVELKQLAQDAADLKNANESRARVATARAQDRRKQLENEIKQQDRLAQMEVERMNREGNKLVEEYKAISARDKDGSLTVEARAQADAAAKSKIEAIQAKQREVQSFIENVRRVLSLRAEELRGLPPDPTGSVNPPWSPLSVERRLELRRTVPSGDGLNNPSASAGDERVSVGLPQADGEGLISAYEHITGTKVTRDPSLANVRGRIDFTTASTTKVETAQAMRAALRTQMHGVLEPTVDGGVVARYSPPR